MFLTQSLSECPYSTKPPLPWKISGCAPDVQSLNFDFRLTAGFILNFWSALGYSSKNPNSGEGGEEGGGGVEDMEFLEVLKKKDVEIPRSIKKEVEFLAVVKKKVCHTTLWNVQRWSFSFSRISKGKVTNLKIPSFFQKVCPQPLATPSPHPPTPFRFFLE